MSLEYILKYKIDYSRFKMKLSWTRFEIASKIIYDLEMILLKIWKCYNKKEEWKNENLE